MAALAAVSTSTATAANADFKLKPQILDLQRQTDTALRAQNGSTDLYRLTKARTWLEMALDEMYEIDRSGIAEDAIAQAQKLLSGDKSNLLDTPIVRGSEKIREDLWKKSAQMKQHKDADCAAARLASLDVQLVWAGHEKWESGWTHARPYVEIAENLAYEAEQDIARCSEARKPRDVPKPEPVITATLTVTVEKFSFATDALFQFDHSGIDHMVAGGQRKLAALANSLKDWKSIESIQISGHTDRLGKDDYNQRLSEARAANVREFLLSLGITAGEISISGLGETEPVVHCNGLRKDAALIACLQPNRRVDITVRGIKQAE